MQKIEQGEYYYRIPQSAEDAVLDFIQDAICFQLDYYFTECRTDGEDQDEIFDEIQKGFQMHADFKDGDFELRSYESIELLEKMIWMWAFDDIRKYPDIDNLEYFYQIMCVWKELDAIVSDHIRRTHTPTG